MKVKSITALFAGLIFISTVNAQTTDEGLQAAQRRDYAKAFEILKRNAENGDPAAMHGLSMMYGQGHGIDRNDVESIYWAMKASEMGDVKAMVIAGTALISGRAGTKIDIAKGVEYLNKASNSGQILANLNLGMYYLLGKYLPIDYTAAKSNLERAALSPYSSSNFYLAKIHEEGLGVPKDLNKALHEYKQALSKVKPTDVDGWSQNRQPLKPIIEQKIQSIEVHLNRFPSATEYRSMGSNSASTTLPSLDTAKAKCQEIGFTPGTEQFGNCVLKLMK